MSRDLEQLKAALAGHGDKLMVELFGEPTTKTARWWRWGRKGSLSYRVDRSAFYSFEEQRGGSLLDAIMFQQGCNFAGAVEYARRFLGDDDTRPRPKPRRTTKAIDADGEADRAAAEALELWRTGRRIDGTAAAHYLQGRAITRWPADLVRLVSARDVARIVSSVGDDGKRKGWSWWRWPALVFPLTEQTGAVRSVQLIALKDDGTAALDRDGKKLKRTRGPMAGCVVRLPGNPAGPLVLAEGGETALSIWLATGFETWAVLGGIGRAALDAIDSDRTIVVARDDDARSTPKKDGTGVAIRFAPALKAVKKAVQRWRREGRRVVEVQPWPISRGDKSDFNDLLQAEGPDAVRARFDAALHPPQSEPGVALKEASGRLETVIRETIDRLLAAPAEAPTRHLVRVTVGGGKTYLLIADVVPRAEIGVPCAIAVPTHAKAEEVAEDLRKVVAERGSSVRVEVWRGRKQEGMCQDLPAVDLALKAGVSVGETVCAPCAHRDACPYIAQTTTQADIWVVTHATLFSARPKNMQGVRFLVVDEDLTPAMIDEVRTHKVHPEDLGALAEVGTRRRRRGRELISWRVSMAAAGMPTDLEGEVQPLHAALLRILERHPGTAVGEFLRRAELVAEGITVEKARQAVEANKARRKDPPACETREEMAAALRAVQPVNQLSDRLVALWEAIANFLGDKGAEAAGRVLVQLGTDGKRFAVQVVPQLGEGWNLPTLHLDATAEVDLLRRRFGPVEVVADIRVAAPHESVTLVTGKTFGKSSLLEGKGMAEEDRKAVQRRQDNVRRDILSRIAGKPGRFLVVTHKQMATKWKAVVPANVEVAHFGGLRGLNQYEDVAGLFVVGRWGVPPGAVENIAAAITGRAAPRVAGWYPVEAVTLRATDGSVSTVDADRHPDPVAEGVRRLSVLAELLQAIGRPRGVRRTAANPVEVVVYGNVVLGLPLASIEQWEPPGVDAQTLAEHGWMLDAPGHAALLAGMRTEAVRQRRHRTSGSTPRCVTFPNRNISLENVTYLLWARQGLGYIRYKAAGAGQREQSGVFDPAKVCPPSREAVAMALGMLLGVAVRLTALHHHDNEKPPGRGSSGLLVDRLGGGWDFGLAPVACDWDAGLGDDLEGGRMIEYPTIEQGDCAVSDWFEGALQMMIDAPAECAELIVAGALAEGVSMPDLAQLACETDRALDALCDDDPDPRRVELYAKIAADRLSEVFNLALRGGEALGIEPREPCHA